MAKKFEEKEIEEPEELGEEEEEVDTDDEW